MGNTNACGCIDSIKEEKSTEIILDSLQKRATNLRSAEVKNVRAFHIDSDPIDDQFNDCSFVRNSDKNLSNSINYLDKEAEQFSLINISEEEKRFLN